MSRPTPFPAIPSHPPHLSDPRPLSHVDLRGDPGADALGGNQLTAGDLHLLVHVEAFVDVEPVRFVSFGFLGFVETKGGRLKKKKSQKI